jgi:hypothetical protein
MLSRLAMCLLGLSGMLSGCIMVPIAVPEEKPFEETAEASMQIGTSAHADVKAVFGEPEITDAHWWLYRDARAGWQWAGCAGVGGSGSCGTTDRGSTEYFLHVSFDAEGILSHYEIFREDRLCEEHKVCFKNGLLMRAARNGDETARAGHCPVYVYSDTDRDSLAGVVEVNGRRVGTLVSTEGYLMHAVPPGRYLWIAFPSGEMMRGATASLALQCDNSETHYLRYRSKIISPTLEAVDEATGQADIADRWRALADIDSDLAVDTNWLDEGRVFVAKEDYALKAYELTEPGKVKRFGIGMSGEPCGLRAAIEDYGLIPFGMQERLQLMGPGFGDGTIDIVAVCNARNECEFASVFEDRHCVAQPVEYVGLGTSSRLLVLEPAGDGYTELYFGKSRPLKKQAGCSRKDCKISLAQLRAMQEQYH